jgi:4a-hydroxytetrahydrobiopterin dehydratase
MDLRPAAEVSNAEGLDDWRVLARSLHASFATGSFAAGIELAQRIGTAADAANHHPDLTITYPRVLVGLTTHDAGGLTDLDIDLARTISTIAHDVGVEAEPTRPAVLEIAIDALDIPVVRRFWHAVYGLDGSSEVDELVDPTGQLPTLWFQQMDGPRPQRNRIHLDLLLPPDLVAERTDAVLAAGGRLTYGDEAPSFWVFADPEGNEVCLCTWQPAAGTASASGE